MEWKIHRHWVAAGVAGVVALPPGPSGLAAAQAPDPADPGADRRALLGPLYFDERVLFEEVPTVTVPTRAPVPLPRAPAAVTVLSGDQVRRSGWATLADAMRLVPGAEVIRTFSTEANVAFRGFYGPAGTSSGVLLLVDGRPIYNDFSGENNWDDVPLALEDIDRVEIVRGPGSFLYGPNAMHGVVNVITKRPRELAPEEGVPRIRVSTVLGSYHTTISSLRAAVRDGDWGGRVTAGWNDVNRFSDPDEPVKEMGFANVLLRRELGGAEHVLEAQAGFHDGGYTTVRTGNLEVDVLRSYGKLTYRRGGFEVQLVHDDIRAEVDNLAMPLVPSGSSVRAGTSTFDAHHRFEVRGLGAHTITAGAGLVFNRGHSADLVGGTRTLWRPAGYLQDEWAPADGLFVTTGARVDGHPAAGTTWSPQASLLYRADERHTFRVGVKTGFRNPSLVESFVEFVSAPSPNPGLPPPFTQTEFQAVPNDRLESERMVSQEAGYSGLWFGRLKTGLDGYHNQVEDVIDFRTVTTTFAPPTIRQVGQFRSDRDVRVLGFEAAAEYLLTDCVSLWGNYALQRAEDEDTGDRVREAPRQKRNAGVRASFPAPGLYADLWVNAFDRTEFGGPPGRLDGWVSVQARVGWRRGASELWLSVSDLNNDRHREHPQGDEFGRTFQVGFLTEF